MCVPNSNAAIGQERKFGAEIELAYSGPQPCRITHKSDI